MYSAEDSTTLVQAAEIKFALQLSARTNAQPIWQPALAQHVIEVAARDIHRTTV
jgi:hypothetical protein